MKFALASYGTRGDIEPSIALGRELVRRGHEVQMAVSPDLVGFVESAGLSAVAYGPDTREWVEKYRDFFKSVLRNAFRPRDLIELLAPKTEHWEQMSTVLMSMADGADLLYTGLNFEQPAANVAEYYKIPLATLHYYPMRPNGQMVPLLPPPVGRSAMRVFDWLFWRLHKRLDDAQRQELGLRKATGPSPRRITELGSLEIQAYDEVCFPGLSSEWGKSDARRPFVGTLTIEFSTDADEEVASWIAAGTPPIYFGFGSVPFESFGAMVEMIGAACAELGERALIRAGGSDLSDVPHYDHVKVVDAVSYAAAFPACRAVVHHGGSGTTAAGLRAGVPTLILWTMGDQPIWGAQIKRLKVGTARRFSATTRESLVTDLRRILAPDYVARAQEISRRMTEPAVSLTKAADLLESTARGKACC
ncbi:glycosyltransferase [Mycobacterium shigaense]|uniref:Uncharacterized protein n=1 Tax=Mycobacterium shigaense TaxID=722731 RepID=A0A1Z4EH69_9MYCO|nr:glycosyltransferase [Mycobacterium shigaense]MEA1123026.1 glycosyltransferase [Mycobacterium shigaense]PRI13408.1 glycosyl transferase family 1 [Mycobacterium shigaense]BAX92324.1 hypothetical protein MSG_02175 [Mycobacterium shigaense]